MNVKIFPPPWNQEVDQEAADRPDPPPVASQKKKSGLPTRQIFRDRSQPPRRLLLCFHWAFFRLPVDQVDIFSPEKTHVKSRGWVGLFVG